MGAWDYIRWLIDEELGNNMRVQYVGRTRARISGRWLIRLA